MKIKFKIALQGAAGIASLVYASWCSAQDITGAGATFPAPVYAKWAADYNKATGVRVNYQSVGSGAGIKQDKPANATEAFKFFTWAYKSGDKIAMDLDYVPMPDSVIGAIEKTWRQVTDASGKPVALK